MSRFNFANYKKVEKNEKFPKGSGYFNFHENEKKNNPHYFLCEELLVPRNNNTDTQRCNMWANHISQLVHLKNPEYPRVFTNFENQVGEYSVAYKKAEEDFDIIARVEKNKYNYDLVIQYRKSKVFDIIHFRKSHIITEDYGYCVYDCIPEKKAGDIVHEGDYIFKSDNYDDDGNFRYGVNLKAVFLPFLGYTYEDAIVISKSAAEKLTSYKTEKIMVSVNSNDVLLNLYGDEENYKSFPRVGEKTGESILVASRRRDKRTLLYNFQASKLREIDNENDELFYTHGGIVTDINVYNNIPLEELRKKKDVFNQEIVGLLDEQYHYWRQLAEVLEKIIPVKPGNEIERNFDIAIPHPIDREKNPNKYTDELGYYWKLAHENTDERILWRSEGKTFENFKIEFTILKENPLTPGCKLTGRYGNKGVVAKIEPDANMPTTEDGEHADICLNSLGVINRCNPSQLIEQHINFMSSRVLSIIKSKDDLEEKAEIFFEYLKALNKEEYDFMFSSYFLLNRKAKQEFFDEIEEKGIYIHQPPMYKNTTREEFLKIMEEHPEWVEPYSFIGIEKPLVMGELYFVRLKHEASNKSSMRSASNLNIKNLPAKSTLRKEHKIQFNSTPIRLGEMEVANLLLTKNSDIVEELLKTYSTNEEARAMLIRSLLSRDQDPFNLEVPFKSEDYPSISREILEKYLNTLGYSLKEE